MHLNDAVLAPLRARFGEPRVLVWEGDVSEAEFALASGRPGSTRRHDVTLFIYNGPRLAVIRKPMYPPGIWRTPGGGVAEGEDVVAGAKREALEETGLAVELERYLVASEAVFRHGGRELAWRTHVFSARTEDDELAPRDAKEIEAARWSTNEELRGPIRAALLATGRAFWRYRVALHDASLRASLAMPASGRAGSPRGRLQ